LFAALEAATLVLMNSDMVSILDLAATSVVATEPEEGRRFAPVGRFFAANVSCYGAIRDKLNGILEKKRALNHEPLCADRSLWKIPSRTMASINVSGLTSNTYGSFDWQTMVDQLIQADTIPVTNLQTKQTANQSQISTLSTIQTDLTQLQTYAQALSNSALFTARTTAVSDANWNATAANGTAAGSYAIAITRLATAANRVGGDNIASKLNATDNVVSGLTLATLPTATAVTAGTFTVNGQTITTTLDESLQSVFNDIHTATGNAVTATYDHTTDTITLANTNPLDTSEIALGAVNDSSNFLQVMKLANNGLNSVTSSSPLGAVALNVPLAQAGLRSSITAVDPVTHDGSFTINGVPISYNLDNDSLSTVLARINSSTAGVTASYNNDTGRVILTNNSTGDVGLGANETAGGLLDALGLTGASTLQHGQNALFSVNGGPAVSSASNTLSAKALGVTGLSVTATTATTQTVTVAVDTASMETAIQNFASQYNTVQSEISKDTSITTGSDGKVTAAVLSNDQDVSNWASNLESRIFATVPGLSGAVTQLANLGLDFDSSGQLIIKDSTKLNDALTNHGTDVAAYFTQASTGMAANVNTYLNQLLFPTGGLAALSDSLVSDNTDIAAQITTLQAQLDRERMSLTTAFEAMQSAQTLAQSQLSYLNAMTNLNKNG
jgi:flagellar hook-associated protein 2